MLRSLLISTTWKIEFYQVSHSQRDRITYFLLLFRNSCWQKPAMESVKSEKEYKVKAEARFIEKGDASDWLNRYRPEIVSHFSCRGLQ